MSQLPGAQQQAIILIRQIQRNHYNPRPVDDSLSSVIFLKFINELDPQQNVFTMVDFKVLSGYRYSLDDELNGSTWSFLDRATEVYRQALKRVDTLVTAIFQKPLDYTTDDKISFSKEKNISFPGSVSEQKNRWVKWFKYVLLNQAYSMAAADSSKPSLKAVLVKNESSLRERIRKTQGSMFEALLDPASFETDLKGIYFNAIANSFDPHTDYFSPTKKEEFQASLSTEGLSFGFEIEENKVGSITVAGLIPGGPAWKTGEIHKDDQVVQLQWKGSAPVDVSAMTVEEAGEYMKQTNHDELTVKLKKTDGTVHSISLHKEKIETEENVVKGYLLSGDKKIGYISLPDFYTTWEDEKGSGCANDLAKEIIKMKKENLDGLILDLRYNGGGSLYEALQLCGIFIDEGPLVGIRGKDGKMVYVKDPNRGTIYDGPLLVMVNNQSASASEMMAAALQDYNRAVIVGSPTYGKATMQQIFPMDSNTVSTKKSPNGFVKITNGKLYRVSGLTAQRNGVIPDIALPDAFDGLEYREKFSPGALPADTMKKNNYYQSLPALPIASLALSSNQRVNNDPSFQKLVQSISIRMEELNNKQSGIPLKTELFEKWMKDEEALMKNMDETGETENKIFTAGNYKLETERLQNNSYASDLNKAALQSIQTDMYVQEAFRIMADLIRIQKQ